MSISLSTLDNVADEPMKTRSAWRRSPARAPAAVEYSPEQLLDSLNAYFVERYDQNEHPTLCDMAGAAGFDSVTQLVNHARRQGGQTMRGISRGILAVAAAYEELAQEGNRSAANLLALMPNFDSKEPADQKPQRPFLPQQEVNLNITGVTRLITHGAQLSEQEAYLQLIKHKTYEEISAEVLETEQGNDGDFRVLTLDTDE